MDNLDYEGFRTQYEKQHPASVPILEFEINEYPRWVRWAVLLTFVCAAMVSGIHTVPTVWLSIETNSIITEQMRTFVSFASLFAIELAILLSAYLLAKGVKLAYAVVIIASLVAILANLYSVIHALNAGGDMGVLVVAVSLGIGAPMIALFTGKMFVDIHRADRVQDAKSKKIYKEACVAWDKEIEKAWKGYQKGAGVSRMSSNDVRSDTTDGRTVGYGYTKRTDAKDIVRAHLETNPDDNSMSVRDLASKLGVGKTTVSDVKRDMQSSNGNGHIE